MKTLDESVPRFRAYRGQSYGIDIIQIDPFGLRASGIFPRKPAAYQIYGEPVLAPCAGTIVQAIDGFPDMTIPLPDFLHLPRTISADDIRLGVGNIGAFHLATRAHGRDDIEGLSAYLKSQGTLFVACYDIADSGRTLLGIGSARLEIKPYDKRQWLYVDEVDVCVDQRQKGAGKAIMGKLIKIARDFGCEEVWLGTEVDNQAANALYRSLDPDDIAEVVGYTFELN